MNLILKILLIVETILVIPAIILVNWVSSVYHIPILSHISIPVIVVVYVEDVLEILAEQKGITLIKRYWRMKKFGKDKALQD